MCKKSLLMMLLLALLVPWAANAQSVQIGDGTNTSSYLPSYSYYNYSVTQQIYTAEEIDASGNITSIAFYNGGSTRARKLAIYMAHTDKSAFEPTEGYTSSSTDWIALTEANKVYEASEAQNITAGEWTTFTLDTPFAYNGTDNLVVGVLDLTGGWESGMSCRVFSTESKQAIYKYQDPGAYGIDGTYNGATQTGTLPSFKNQIVLGGIQQAFPAPSNLTASNLYGHGATIDWTENGTATSWKVAYKVSTDEEFTEMTVNSKPYTFTGLNPETTYNVKVCALNGSQQSNWSSVISFTTTVACPAPTGLAAALTPGNGSVATLSWTSDASAWFVAYKTADATDFTEVNVTENPYTLTSLTPETTYNAKVKAVCGGEDGESSWSNTITFTPTDAYFLTVNDGTTTNGYVPIFGTWVDAITKSQFIIPAENLADMAWGTINKMTFYGTNTGSNPTWGAAQFEVYMTETNETTLSALADYGTMTKVMNSAHLQIDGNQMVVEFDAPYQYMGGNLMIGFLQTVTGSYSGCTWYGVSAEGASMGGYGTSISQRNFLPKTTFDYIPGEEPSCFKPTGLAVEYTGGTEATISWNSDAEAWNMRVNGVDVNGVITNPYTLTGLEYATTYQVEVQANCGDNGTSEWAGPVSFTTDLCAPENMCEITITLTDAYGDGGGNIQVVDVLTNEVLRSFTNSGESTTYTLAVCDGRELNFVYASTDNWSYENGWVITDINNEIISEHVGCTTSGSCDAPTNGVIANYTVNCTVTTCRRPTNLAASEIGNRSAVLSWTENGEATEWVVEITDVVGGQITEWNASTNPYTLVGLAPETNYSVRVRPICSDFDDKWSTAITFTTDVACPAPQNIVVSGVTTNSALVSWLGFGESYDLRYAAMPSSKGMRSSINKKPAKTDFNCKTSFGNVRFASSNDKPAMVSGVTGIQHNRDGWYYYDNGETANYAIGTNGGNFYWGIMIPAGSYLETTLTKTSVYDELAMTGTVYIYNDGTDAPAGEALAQADVTLTGAGAFVETEFSEPVIIDPSKNLWIVYYNGSGATYPAATCTAQSDANGRWVSIDGTSWMDVASAVAGCGNFMVRAYLEGAIALDWIEIPSITASEYELTGLDPETTYLVQIRSNCGDEGQSDYAGTNFTTMSLCDNPYDLDAIEVNATSAILNWTGAQESYNLRYRHALETDPTAPATIILTAGDIWQDSTGYQMLLDADATAYGTIIPTTSGGLTANGDVADSIYAVFEYKIPVNADGALTTQNIVINNSISIQIPAGTYDWCITNPTPGDRVWIAAGNGIGGRYDDFVFEPGMTYEFTIARYGENDGVDLTTTTPMSDWTVVENVTNPYELTGLTAETYYEWQIQGVNPSCDELEWSEIQSFTTPEQTTLTQAIALSSGKNWVSFYVETNLEALKDALAGAAPAANISIKSQTQTTTYNPTNQRWAGRLTLDLAQMFVITISTACEIELEGMPIDPAEHPITISAGGKVWIGFPLSASMTLTDAFAGFAVSGDKVSNQTSTCPYNRGRWGSQISALEPGKGYKFLSNDSNNRVLVYPSGAKAE